jgi:F-type H+-transporting ATPase subunit b
MRRLESIFFVLMVASVTWASAPEHGADTEVGLFSGTFADALWTVLAFVVLLAILGKYAWGPLLKTLNARQQQIETQLKTAQAAQERAETILGEYRQKGESLLQQAANQAHAQQKQAQEKIQQEVAALRRNAAEDIENAKAAAMDQLWQQAGDMVFKLSTQVLERTVTKQDNQHLISKALSQLKEEKSDSA